MEWVVEFLEDTWAVPTSTKVFVIVMIVMIFGIAIELHRMDRPARRRRTNVRGHHF